MSRLIMRNAVKDDITPNRTLGVRSPGGSSKYLLKTCGLGDKWFARKEKQDRQNDIKEEEKGFKTS